IKRDTDLPPDINTDPKRLQQILKNLLSNAFKFTDKGHVSLDIGLAERRSNYATETLREADQVIAFSVSDTGIGIPLEKQRIIFEAFQQADGTTSRKYGGTGLGLSISREIARLLGGEIRVVSSPGEGSVFTLFIPRIYKPAAQAESRGARIDDRGSRTEDRRSRAEDRLARNGAIRDHRSAIRDLQPSSGDYGEIIEVADDRNNFKPGDRVALIIEDDAPFAQVLLDIAHERGFKGVVASQGSAALWLAHRYKPDVITLDIRLPDRDGWTVLDRLKHDPKTSHIPVHVITADDREIQPRRLGALTYLRKPVTREHLVESFDRVAEFAGRRTRRLLVVEGDDAQRASVVDLIGDGAVWTTAVATGEEALARLRGEQFDCMALNPKLPDMSGAELIEAMRREPTLLDLPIIVYDGKDLSGEGGRGAISGGGRGDDRQGGPLARTSVCRDLAISAPRRGQPAGAEAQDAGTVDAPRPGARRAQGADR